MTVMAMVATGRTDDRDVEIVDRAPGETRGDLLAEL
jgi:hypothetical protein